MAKYKVTDGCGGFLNNAIYLGDDHGGTCEMCHKEHCETIYDSRTKYGYWCYVCQDCFDEHGVGLGVGYGQKWEITK